MDQESRTNLSAMVAGIVASPEYQVLLNSTAPEARVALAYVQKLQARLEEGRGVRKFSKEVRALEKGLGSFAKEFERYLRPGAGIPAVPPTPQRPTPAVKAPRPPRPVASSTAPKSQAPSVAHQAPLAAGSSFKAVGERAKQLSAFDWQSRAGLTLWALPLAVNAFLLLNYNSRASFEDFLGTSAWLVLVAFAVLMVGGLLVAIADLDFEHAGVWLYFVAAGVIGMSFVFHSAQAREREFVNQLPECIQAYYDQVEQPTLRRAVRWCRSAIGDREAS